MANKLSDKIKRISAKGAILLGMSMLLASSAYGCVEETAAVPNEEYDMIDPSGSIVDDEGDLLFGTGVTKVLPVKGETFKLVVTFSYDNSKTRSWNIATDKFLNYAVNTDGLPAGYEVYVDNVCPELSQDHPYSILNFLSKKDSNSTVSLEGFK